MADSSEDEEVNSNENEDLYSNDGQLNESPKRGREKIVSDRFLAAIDRFKLSDRATVHILFAAAEVFGRNPIEYNLNRTSIRAIRKQFRMAKANEIKTKFKVRAPFSSNENKQPKN